MKSPLQNTLHSISTLLPDKLYLQLKYRKYTGRWIDFSHPVTFNEKLQWLKLHDRNPAYTQMVDKYEVRRYIGNKIGEQYLIPLLGVWDHVEDIDFDSLPSRFVLKCTHDSGGLIICKDKSQLDTAAARLKLKNSLRRNFYYYSREWPYKDVKPRIIAEQYMEEEGADSLKDYKIFAFDGVPRFIQVDFDRFTDHKRNLYTPDWEYMEAGIQFPSDGTRIIERPENLEEMLSLSSILSTGIPHVRTDFYSIRGKTYFGELTFFHGGGYETFTPASLGVRLGSFIHLPQDRLS